MVEWLAMSKKQSDVHAYHGKWEVERDKRSGQVLSYVGRFHPEDEEHAMGAARFFAHSKMAKAYRKPLKDDDNRWVVRLAYDQDNLKKFEQWERFAELLPERAKEIDHEIQMRELAPLLSEPKPELRFLPLAQDFMENILRRLPWQMVEVGAKHTFVVETEIPELALQVATYLERHQYISQDDFRRIQTDAHHAMRNKQQGTFRIGIEASKIAEFEQQFIVAPKPEPLSPPIIAQVIRKSHPNGRGWKIAG